MAGGASSGGGGGKKRRTGGAAAAAVEADAAAAPVAAPAPAAAAEVNVTVLPVLHAVGLIARKDAASGAVRWLCDNIPGAHLQLQHHFDTHAGTVPQFMQDLSSAFAEEANLRAALMPLQAATAARATTADEATFIPQDSLVKLLLKTDAVQSVVIQFLLEKLPEFMEEDKGAAESSSFLSSTPRLILSQLRWLDFVADPQALTDKLLQCLQVCPPFIQRELISFLPEIVDESQHQRVVGELTDLLSSDTGLTVAILESMSSLSLKAKYMSQAIETVIGCLTSCDLPDLPAVIRYLVQAAVGDNSNRVVHAFRQSLTFQIPSSASGRDLEVICDNHAMIVQALWSGLRLQPDLSGRFLTVINNQASAELIPLDVIVLVLLHGTNAWAKKAEAVFRRKLSHGEESEVLLKATLRRRARALEPHYRAWMSLAQLCVCNSSVAVGHTGAMLYRLLFEEFSDGFHRQEVVGALVTHIGSANRQEIDNSLECLETLVSTPTMCTELRTFAPFIKGMLDFVQALQDRQVRSVYNVLCGILLARAGAAGGSPMSHDLDELHIVLRKQLTHANTKLRRVGVIGAIALTCQLSGAKFPTEEQAAHDIRALLDMVFTCCRGSVTAISFVYEELAWAIELKQLLKPVVEWIGGRVCESFDVVFFTDLDGGKLPAPVTVLGGSVKCHSWQNLDGELCNAALRLMPLYCSADPMERDSLSYLCQQFQLMVAAVAFLSDGNLQEVDACLGAPLVLADMDSSDVQRQPDLTQTLICGSVYHAANWIRALLNAYTTQPGAAVHLKLIQRLHDLLELEDKLMRILNLCPNINLDSIVPADSLAEGGADKGMKRKVAAVGAAPDGKPAKKAATAGPKKAKATKAKKPAAKRGRKGRKGAATPESKDSDAEEEDVDIEGSGDEDQVDEDATESETEDPQIVDDDATEIDTVVTRTGKAAKTDKQVAARLALLTSSLIEIQPHVLKMLTFAECAVVVTDPDAEVDGKGFTVPLLAKLMDTLHQHVKTRLESKKKLPFGGRGRPAKGDGSGLSSTVWKYSPEKLLEDLVLPISKNLRQYCDTLTALVSVSHRAAKAMACLEHLFGTLRIMITSQTVLTNHAAKVHLCQILACFSEEDMPAHPSLVLVATSSFKYFAKVGKNLHNLALSVELLELLTDLVDLALSLLDEADMTAKTELRSALAHHALALLQNDWAQLMREPKLRFSAANIGRIINVYLSHSPSSLDAVEVMTLSVLPRVIESDPSEEAEQYPCLNAETVGMFYAPTMAVLTKAFADIDRAADPNAVILRLSKAVHCFHALVTMTRVLDRRPVLLAALKSGRAFVDVFVKWVPMISQLARKHASSTMSMMKKFQQCTRQLQALCAHSKVTKDSSMMAAVPALKKAMEAVIFHVKAMAAASSALDAFSLGVLKNRTLDGTEIDDAASDQEEAAEA